MIPAFSKDDSFVQALEVTHLAAAVLRQPRSTDEPYTYLYINSLLLGFLGGAADRWLGKAAELHFANPESRKLFYSDFPYPYPKSQWGYDVTLRNGTSRRDVLMTLVWSEPIRFNGVNAIIAWFYDMTQRRDLEKVVTREKALLNCLINSIPDIIYYKGTDGRYLGFNSAFEMFVGLHDSRKSKDDHLNVENRFDTEGPLGHRQLDEHVLETGASRRQEEWWIGPDGARSCIDILRTPYVGPDGSTLGMVGIGRDISQHKALEQALKRAKEAAESAESYKIEFLAKISHELRTPLNAVMGLLQLMDSTSLDRNQRGYLDRAYSATRLLREIVQNILDYAKIEAQSKPLEITEFSLKELAENLLDVLAFDANYKGIRLRLEYESTAPTFVRGDAQHIRCILSNLVSNAIKCTDEGSVTLAISHVEKDHSNVRMRFSVIDTGCGIDMREYESYFQPFVQGVNARTRKTTEGSGLGLTICRQLVNRMNGELHCDSEIGRGTEFFFSVQLGRAEDDALLASAVKDVEEAALILAGKSVLLVEDNDLNREIMTELLSQGDLVVESVQDGVEAYQAVKQKRFDVVLMDVQMHRMDGYEAARLIRTEKNGADLPIIALTAHGMHEERQRAFGAGMNAFVRKPVEKSRLLKTIAAVIETARKRTTRDAAEMRKAALLNSPSMDLAAFIDQIGDGKRAWHFLRRFWDQYRDITDRLARVAARGEYATAWKLAHEFKSVAGVICARKLADKASDLEGALRANDAESATELMAELRAELAAVLTHILSQDPIRDKPDTADKVLNPWGII